MAEHLQQTADTEPTVQDWLDDIAERYKTGEITDQEAVNLAEQQLTEM